MDTSDDEDGEHELHPLLQAHRRPIVKTETQPVESTSLIDSITNYVAKSKTTGRVEDMAKIYMTMKYKPTESPDELPEEIPASPQNNIMNYNTEMDEPLAPPPPPPGVEAFPMATSAEHIHNAYQYDLQHSTQPYHYQNDFPPMHAKFISNFPQTRHQYQQQPDYLPQMSHQSEQGPHHLQQQPPHIPPQPPPHMMPHSIPQMPSHLPPPLPPPVPPSLPQEIPSQQSTLMPPGVDLPNLPHVVSEPVQYQLSRPPDPGTVQRIENNMPLVNPYVGK